MRIPTGPIHDALHAGDGPWALIVGGMPGLPRDVLFYETFPRKGAAKCYARILMALNAPHTLTIAIENEERDVV